MAFGGLGLKLGVLALQGRVLLLLLSSQLLQTEINSDVNPPPCKTPPSERLLSLLEP